MPGPDSVAMPSLLRLPRRRQYRLRRRHFEGMPTADSPAIEAAAPAEAAPLPPDAKQWIDKAARLQDALLRTQSDFESFRRRMQREREDSRTAITADILTAFVPVLDHFELALKAVESSPDTGSIVQGVTMIHRELSGVMQSLGVEKMLDIGKPFDPSIHEAVALEANPEKPHQTILEILRPGWRYRDRCLRPAMVKVNRLPEGSSGSPSAASAPSAPATAPSEPGPDDSGSVPVEVE